MRRALIAVALVAGFVTGFVTGAARLDADESGGLLSIAPAAGPCYAFVAWGDGADNPVTLAFECEDDGL